LADGKNKMLGVGWNRNEPRCHADLNPGEMNLLYNASSLPSALMFAALNEQDFLWAGSLANAWR